MSFFFSPFIFLFLLCELQTQVGQYSSSVFALGKVLHPESLVQVSSGPFSTNFVTSCISTTVTVFTTVSYRGSNVVIAYAISATVAISPSP